MTTRPISNVVTTWTNAGTSYTGLGVNVYSTAYATDSRPFNIRVNGNSIFSVDAAGTVRGNSVNIMFATANAAYNFANNLAVASGDPSFAFRHANSAFDKANTAYSAANNAFQNTTGTFTGTLTVTGDIYAGVSQSASNIWMGDTDEGTRRIHCNSNRIGFLNQSDGWGSWCDDSGYWQSDYSVRAPIFYDSNDTGYYLDPNSTSNLYRLNVNGSSLGGSGYTRLVNGVIIQWGNQSVGANSRWFYNFPISFPSGCYGFAATGDWADSNGWQTCGGAVDSASGFYLTNVIEGTRQVYWMAIGF